MKSWNTDDVFVSPVPSMTLRAWEPWLEARSLLFEFYNSDIDDEHTEWRIHWFAGVAILRTIGHVLHNVDASTSFRHRTLLGAIWNDWHEDKDDNWIFFDFIERERNNVLKEFSFGANLPTEEDGRLLAYGNTEFDAIELFAEAVYWWRRQLQEIERCLNGSSIQDPITREGSLPVS